MEWRGTFKDRFGDTFRLCCDDKTLQGAVESFIENILEQERNKYQELIYAVESKHQGETRHQTALRYIFQAENSSEPEKESKETVLGEGKSDCLHLRLIGYVEGGVIHVEKAVVSDVCSAMLTKKCKFC